MNSIGPKNDTLEESFGSSNMGSGLILGSLGVVLLTNPIYSALSLGLVLVCISLFYILSNSDFVAAA